MSPEEIDELIEYQQSRFRGNVRDRAEALTQNFLRLSDKETRDRWLQTSVELAMDQILLFCLRRIKNGTDLSPVVQHVSAIKQFILDNLEEKSCCGPDGILKHMHPESFTQLYFRPQDW